MNIHKNARLTPIGRERLVRLMEGGLSGRRAGWFAGSLFTSRGAGVSPATVSRVLRRAGLSRLKDLDPAELVHRYERESPGEIIHLDIKKLGRFEPLGHRVTRDRTGQSNPRGHKQGGYGSEYVHVAIDDHSRLSFCQIHPDEKINNAIAHCDGF